MSQNYTVQDFLENKIDSYLQSVNMYSDQANEYTPYNPHLLNKMQYDLISTTVAQFPYIVSQWIGVVGANDSTVIVNIRDDYSDRTRKEKENLKLSVYNFLYNKLNFSNIEKQTIQLIAKEGNAVWLLNSDGNVIVESIFRFNVYWDSQNKKARYAYKKDGSEVAGMTNLQHDIDIYHFKDSIYSSYAVSPSRLDSAFIYLLLENKALRANINLFAHGMVGALLLKFSDKLIPDLKQSNLPQLNGGQHWFNRLMDKVNDMLAGVGKSNRISSIAGLEDVIEPGKSNRDSQFMELLKDLTPERLAWAYSMTLADFGAGGATTYNNVSSFNDALYDKIGRSIEQSLDHARNNWLLPLFGIQTNSKFYIKYNQPEDPNKLKESQASLEDWKNNAITLNEYREIRGKEPLPNGDVTISQYIQPQDILNNVVDVQPNEQASEFSFFEKAVLYKKTPTEKALDTKQKKNSLVNGKLQ